MDELQAVLKEKLLEAEKLLTDREEAVVDARMALGAAYDARNAARAVLREIRRRNLLPADEKPRAKKPQAPQVDVADFEKQFGSTLDADPTLAGAAEAGGEGE